jgi:flagellar protein FliO/FliZ
VTGLAQSASPLSVSSLAQLTLSLMAILALIVAISWILRRFKLANPRSRGAIAVIDELALGPRERIVLLSVGDCQVLVGVGAGGVVALSPLSTPIAVPGQASAAPFADRLREFLKRPGSPG